MAERIYTRLEPMNKALIDTFIRYNHLKLLEGECGAMDLFYPYLLMDVAYQIFVKDIKGIECRRDMKKCKKQWHDAYTSYWQKFFAPFTPQQCGEITDLMDGYAEYINTQVLQLRVAAMNVIGKQAPEFSHQTVLSACFLCATLARCADIVHGVIFKNSFGKPTSDANILKSERKAQEFSDYYIEQQTNIVGIIRVGSDKAVNKVMDSLIAKLVKFPELIKQKQYA